MRTEKERVASQRALDPASAVQNPRATCMGTNAVRVTWDAPENFKVDGYRITRLRQQIDPDSPVTDVESEKLYTWQLKNELFVPPHQKSFDETKLAENTTFRYKVTAWHYNASRRKIFGREAMTNKFRVYEELPEGWAAADTDEGKRYYFNVVTKHTQWEKPEENSRTFLPLALAKHFTPQEVVAMRREFDAFDIDGNGSISSEELEEAFYNLGFKFSKEQFHEIFKKVDADGSGFVDFQEYAGMYVKMSNSKTFQGLFGQWSESLKAFSARFAANARLKFEESLADLVSNTKQKLKRKLRRRMPPIWVKTIDRDQEYYYNIRTHETSWVLPDEQRYYLPDDFGKEFTEKELAQFRELFDKYDFDDSGTMNVEELTTALQSLGTYEGTLSKERSQQIMQMCDVDKSGQIEFCEFCVAVWAAKNGKMSIGQMFNTFIDQAKGLDETTARLQRQEAKEKKDKENRRKQRVTIGMVFTFTLSRERKSGRIEKNHYTATVINIDEAVEGDPFAFPHQIEYVFDDGGGKLEPIPDTDPEWVRLLWRSKTLTDQHGHSKIPWKLYKIKRNLKNLLKGALAGDKKGKLVQSKEAKARNVNIKIKQFFEKLKIKPKKRNKRKVDKVARWFQEIGLTKKQVQERRQEWRHDSASFLQKHFRGRSARKRMAGVRVQRTFKTRRHAQAATVVQSAVRRRIARRRVQQVRVWTYSKPEEHKAALNLQKIFRSRLARKVVLKRAKKAAYLFRTKKRTAKEHVELIAAGAKSLADKLSKSVNNHLAKVRAEAAQKAADKRKKEAKSKFSRATGKLKQDLRHEKKKAAGIVIKEKFEQMAEDLKKQNETLNEKTKKDLAKMKDALTKAFAKENIKAKAELVRAKVVAEWKKRAAEFKESKLGQQVQATKDEFRVVRVKEAPSKRVEGKALFAFKAEKPEELDMPADTNIEVIEVYDTQDEQLRKMEKQFEALDKQSVGLLGPEDIISCIAAAGVLPPEDKDGESPGSAIQSVFAKYGEESSLVFPNGSPKNPEDARMSMGNLRKYMQDTFDNGSTWVLVRNQDTGAQGQVPLSYIHLFDPLPTKEKKVCFHCTFLLVTALDSVISNIEPCDCAGCCAGASGNILD